MKLANNSVKTGLVLTLLVISTLSLILAFTFPVAGYTVASKEKIDELFGGAEGVQVLYEQMASGLSDYARDNSDEMEETALTYLDDLGACVFPMLCTMLRQGNGMLASMIVDVIEPVMVSFGKSNIDRFYESISSFLYDQFQKSEFAKVRAPNIFQVVQSLMKTNQTYLALLIVIFTIVFPVIKLIVSAFNLVAKDNVIVDNLYSITSKLSLTEVFVIAVLIVSFHSLPFMSIEVGVIAMTGYTGFTLSMIAIDVVRAWKLAPVPAQTPTDVESDDVSAA